MGQIWPATVAGLVFGSIYALMALGYTLIYRVLNVINFAHAESFMVGTFGTLFAARWLGILPGPDSVRDGAGAVVALGVVLVAAVVFAAAASAALELAVFGPLRRRGGGPAPTMIAALGASLFLQEVFGLWRGRDLEPFPRLLEHTPLFTVFGVGVSAVHIVVVVVALLVALGADRFVNSTQLGAAIRATAQDRDTATLMGINTGRVILLTFVVAGVTAGVGATLFMTVYENTYYFIGFVIGIKSFTAALLGGMGNVRGAILGGYLVGVMENYGAIAFGAEWKDTVVVAVLVLVLLVRPTGVLGTRLQTVRV
ncbi:branched-chain amino acid ABC transporter permease [Pseudonocardia acidicola]|uniref:Branched-chain amino acid ABC transporter permease n=1 Tax=Pseudonocardia acidicola TaxID=2724939 RepID=A0ABX1S947_9PSEU|nr:branched-chain amino acid ABC transporter permease [Pseudonocardia acidicola]NMH96871.1 branched-chain amino acid ABC transporter permease [Pseudonocardia acidicola]